RRRYNRAWPLDKHVFLILTDKEKLNLNGSYQREFQPLWFYFPPQSSSLESYLRAEFKPQLNSCYCKHFKDKIHVSCLLLKLLSYIIENELVQSGTKYPFHGFLSLYDTLGLWNIITEHLVLLDHKRLLCLGIPRDPPKNELEGEKGPNEEQIVYWRRISLSLFCFFLDMACLRVEKTIEKIVFDYKPLIELGSLVSLQFLPLEWYHLPIGGPEECIVIDRRKELIEKEGMKMYGMNCLIQFEDFANINAFRLLRKYQNQYCTFNDDIQGTASVAVAGILAALRITKNKLSDQTVLFQGAGEAALGIAHLIVMAMEKEGLSKEQAIKKIWLVDSKGLIVKGRAALTQEKEEFAHEHKEMKNLEAIVQDIKPTALIGVAAIGGAFSEQIIKDMAAFNERPIIFALSNPTSKAECTAEQCYKLTKGRAIFASGSPFDPVTLPSGKTLYPGQGNNSYVFPGVALGVVACGLRHITDKIFLTTAEVIAQQVSDKHLEEGRLYPPLDTIRDVSLKIAEKIVKDAYQEKTATVYPEPPNKEAFVRSQMYSTDYDQILPDCYPWPKEAQKIQTKLD
ncbi:hypothetical protein FD754_012531, partial [Muntiacus muntjak]